MNVLLSAFIITSFSAEDPFLHDCSESSFSFEGSDDELIRECLEGERALQPARFQLQNELKIFTHALAFLSTREQQHFRLLKISLNRALSEKIIKFRMPDPEWYSHCIDHPIAWYSYNRHKTLTEHLLWEGFEEDVIERYKKNSTKI